MCYALLLTTKRSRQSVMCYEEVLGHLPFPDGNQLLCQRRFQVVYYISLLRNIGPASVIGSSFCIIY